MAREERQCDVDDVLCEIETLQHLRGLRKSLSNETFSEKFPELKDLDSKITSEIESHRGSLREALEKCGYLSEEILPEPEVIEESLPELESEETEE